MNHYRTITVQPPTSTLTNFPLLVRIQNHPMTTRIVSQYGYDVCFVDSDDHPLDFDLDYYDPVSQSGAWWVKIPSLPAGEETTIKMRYGDSTIISNQSSPLSVWADYGAVYHFSELNGTSQLNSANGLRSSAGLGSSLSFQTSNKGTGRLLRAAYSGNADDKTQGITTQMSLTSPNYSVTMIMKNRSTANNGAMFLCAFVPNYNSSDSWQYHNNVSLQVQGSGILYFFAGAFPHVSTTTISNSTPGVFLHGASLCKDSWRYTQVGSTFTSGNVNEAVLFSDYTEFLSLVSAWNANIQYDIDELRLCKVAHNQAWMAYENENYMNHDNTVAYGPEMNSDGTRAIKFFPWIPMQTVLD